MSYTDVIEDIRNLPHFREYVCRKCGCRQKVYILQVQNDCKNCGSRSKLRRFVSAGSEVEDVIDAVLEWVGKGDDFDQAMKWKKNIDSSD